MKIEIRDPKHAQVGVTAEILFVYSNITNIEPVGDAELDTLLALIIERRGLSVAQIVAATQSLATRHAVRRAYSGDWPEGVIASSTFEGES